MNKTPKKKNLTNYFFVERFTSPVSDLGWSLIGPSIEEAALKEPLRYLGFYQKANEKLVYIVKGFPYAKKEAFQTLFQIVPKKLITQDKLNHFLKKEDLKDFNFKFIFSRFPYLFTSAFRDLNWFPFYHFFKWKKFRADNELWYEEYRKANINKLNIKELIKEIEKLIKRTKKFLKLHRWSFVYSEIFFGLLKGLIRRWIPTEKIDEDIEIAEKLCSGFKQNPTAQMDREIYQLSKEIFDKNHKEFVLKDDLKGNLLLKDFINKYGHRSESLDIQYPTWRENSTFIIDMINANLVKLRSEKFLKQKDTYRIRIETTKYCKNQIIRNSFLFIGHIKLFMFNVILYITQRFMILREVQRDQWHKILSQKRRIVKAIGKKLISNSKLEQNKDIFYLKYNELKKLIDNRLNKSEAEKLILERKDKEQTALKPKKKNTSKSSSNTFSGIGVSSGRVEGRAVIINNLSEMKKLKSGDILVTKIVDSSWTPVFNIISGLITEVGGMLSHGAVVARELGLPAIAGVENATKNIPQEATIKINGKKGLIKISKKND